MIGIEGISCSKEHFNTSNPENHPAEKQFLKLYVSLRNTSGDKDGYIQFKSANLNLFLL